MTEDIAKPKDDRDTEDFYRAVVDCAPEAIVAATPEGEITFLNKAAETLLGYAAKDVVGKSLTVLAPPQPGRKADVVAWLARWSQQPVEAQGEHLHLQARRADGRPMPVDLRVAEGRLGGQRRFFVTVRDATARQKELAAYKDANLRAARILLLSADAIVTVDAEQNITSFNLAAEKMFGYRSGEVEGKPLTMLMSPEARAAHGERMEAFAASSTPSRMMSERAPIHGLRRNGEVFPIEATITKIPTPSGMAYSAQLRDISERRAAQARVEESERRFRAIFDNAAGAIALLTPDGSVVEINRAARDLTTAGESLIGRPLWDLPWIGGGDLAPNEAARQRLKDAVEAAAKGLTVRYTAELRDGEQVRPIDLSLKPITDETGKVAYILPEGHEVPAREG